jgi:hypothetical protein
MTSAAPILAHAAAAGQVPPASSTTPSPYPTLRHCLRRDENR